ncbi:MAG: UDP-N-acetylglucosamine 2-epimerase (non-hydrolyzing) [Chloroflexi bacterium]|nr:UDP-N-acetylglucosamine 2-epimerase (non-hydrolyzing) [Chloroflexota bacterium]
MPKTVLHVVGARPNLVKVAPIMRDMARTPERFRQVLVHTGQHYDDRMSRIFFDELGIPNPDVHLGVGSGSHAYQTATIMQRLEQTLLDYRPDVVVVYGDANSTLAGALTAAKLDLPVAHVEAGLRSFDRTMPEETNRVVTDHISELLFTPSRDADANLAHEGIDSGKVHFVGNVMIDTLEQKRIQIENRPILDELGLMSPEGNERKAREFIVATLHRPANVDDVDALRLIVDALTEVGRRLPVVFPVHPRTRKSIGALRSLKASPIMFTEPTGYLDFLCLLRHATLVVTDSGGVQEETTYLYVPCLTVRPNTERPVTITQGTNRLVDTRDGNFADAIREALDSSREPARNQSGHPELWDGKTAARISGVLSAL